MAYRPGTGGSAHRSSGAAWFVAGRLEACLFLDSHGELPPRRRVRRSLPTAEARRAFWKRVFAGPAVALAFTGQTAAALAALRRETPDAK